MLFIKDYKCEKICIGGYHKKTKRHDIQVNKISHQHANHFAAWRQLQCGQHQGKQRLPRNQMLLLERKCSHSASGSCKCNPEGMRASRVLQRGTVPLPKCCTDNKTYICNYSFHWQAQNQTGLCIQYSTPSVITSMKPFTYWKSCNGIYYICVSGGN